MATFSGRSPRAGASSAPLLLFALALLASLGVGAPAPAGTLHFAEPVIRLGRLRTVGLLEQRFPFRVNGAEGVDIAEMRPGCGCLKPYLAKTHYEPGETGEIILTIHTASQKPGPHRFPLAVTVREPISRTVDLAVEVDLYADVQLEPNNLLVMLRGRAPLVRTVRLTDARPQGVSIREVVCSSPRVRAKVLQASGPRGELELHIAGDLPDGRYDEQVAIRLNDPDYPEIILPVTISRTPRISAAPEVLRLSASLSTDNSAVLQRLLFVRDAAGEPVEVIDARCDLPGVHCQWPKEATPRPRVQVRVDTNSAAVTQGDSGIITIRTARPVATEILVPLEIEPRAQTRAGR